MMLGTSRRTPALLTAATLGLTVAVAGPTPVATPASAAESDAADPGCQVRVLGVADRSNRLRSIDVSDGVVERVRVSDRRLRFGVTGLGFIGSEGIKGGHRTFHRAATDDGVPATLTLTYRRGEPRMSRTVRRFSGNRGDVDADLFTATPSPIVYAKRGPRVRQFTTYHEPGRPRALFFGRKRRIGAAAADLTTLAFVDRRRFKRRANDILLATTRSGGLVQLRVPVRRPDLAVRRTLATSGFADVRDISVGYCRDDRVMLVTLARAYPNDAPVVEWHTLGRTREMRPRTLTTRGEVIGDVHWRMHAVV